MVEQKRRGGTAKAMTCCKGCCSKVETPGDSSQGKDEGKDGVVVTQLMRDMSQLESVPAIPSSQGTTVVSHVLTYYTQNKISLEADGSIKEDEFDFNWMGIARLYLAPPNLGTTALQTAVAKNSVVRAKWIRVKLLNVTFSTTEAVATKCEELTTPEDSDTPAGTAETATATTGSNSALLTLDGTTFSMAYFPAESLKKLPADNTTNGEISTQMVGDSFVRSVGNNNDATLGVGFTTPTLTGVNTQYAGNYACQAEGAKTERLGSACECLIKDPDALTLTLTSTQQKNTTGMATNKYTITPQQDITFAQVLDFQGKQGSSTKTEPEGAMTPLYGLVQIDLPEDLVQELYQSSVVALEKKSIPDPETPTETLTLWYKSTTTKYSVLNANYKLLVEYGFAN